MKNYLAVAAFFAVMFASQFVVDIVADNVHELVLVVLVFGLVAYLLKREGLI